MRAAFFTGAGRMEVRDVESPAPKDGEALLSVRYCGVCGSDLSLFKTGILSGPDVVLGHEIVATVAEDRAGRHRPGARVVPFPYRGCGRCLWCTEGRPMFCLERPDHWGGLAELAAYGSATLLPVP